MSTVRGGDIQRAGETQIMAEIAARFEALKKAHEPKIYAPEFIPFYLEVWKKHSLTEREVLLYGFIRFYTKNKDKAGKRQKFYFSNEDLGEMLNWKDNTAVSKALSKLKTSNLIDIVLKRKADGGKIRFIELVDKS